MSTDAPTPDAADETTQERIERVAGEVSNAPGFKQINELVDKADEVADRVLHRHHADADAEVATDEAPAK